MLAASESEIVILDRGKSLWTTSLDVAEKFDRKHQHVLESIRNLECPDDFHRSNFRHILYQDSHGRDQSAYEITRDGFTLLAMSFSGKRATKWKIAYINAFNLMEQRILSASSPEPSRFDLMNVEFRQHYCRLTGLVFCPAVYGGWQMIEWWNTATEADAADGSIKDMGRVWKRQTRKLELVWDAWVSGSRITLNKIQDILEIEFGY